MEVESILLAIKKKNVDSAEAELTDDVLSINCRKCSKVPDFRAHGCLRCIIHHISQQGSAGRIRLRTSRDLELFGPAAEILCEMAGFYVPAVFNTKRGDGKSCADCDNSYQQIMAIIWAGFPDPKFDSARGRLMSFRPSDSRCNQCIQKTYRALDQMELATNNLKKKISIEAARTGGI